MMVAIGFLQDLWGHAQEPCGLQIGTPRCISQVAAVWRKVCGVTRPGRRASPTAVLNPFFTEATGLPLNSTKLLAISLRSRFSVSKLDQAQQHDRALSSIEKPWLLCRCHA
jgi:hypothetical protein